MADTRERWKSRTGFLLAAIGSAIGLGNIWRFNYICYKNGGGAFLVPYLTALVVAGLSLLLLEYAIGHKYRGSIPVAYMKVGKKWEWVGWMTVNVAMFGILIYYAVVLAWVVNFLVYSFSLTWGKDPNTFFTATFLKLTKSPWELGGMQWHIVGSLLVVWFLNWLITFRGVQRGVELACKIFMPLLLVLAIILVIRGVTLPGSMEGIRWYLTPDFAALKDYKVWQAAFSQIFFSIGVGFGIMIAYSSYLPERANLTGNAMITALTNSAFSLFMAFAVFGTLGYMATMTGQEANQVVTSGPILAFVAFPKAISLMPAPHFFAVLFFSCLLVAGLSSSISIVEGFGAGLMDKFGMSRKVVVTLLCSIGFLGGLVYCTGAGLFWLDIVDHFVMNYAAVPLAIVECIVFGWLIKGAVKKKQLAGVGTALIQVRDVTPNGELVGTARGTDVLRIHINEVSDRKIRTWWVWTIRFVVPTILAIITALGLWSIFTGGYEGYPVSALLWIGLGAITIFFVLALILAHIPWRKDKHPDWENED